ncbi:MAG TPA: spore maturation protein [Firmicutes bacterium]|nr:spore maturation protein [Bacillota bacterium]
MFANAIDVFSTWFVPILVAIILCYGLYKKVDIYALFIEGAKEGFDTVVRIIPYLVGIFVAIGVFRTCGVLPYLSKLFAPVTSALGVTPDVIPHIITRSLSGSGSTGVMSEILKAHGPDSFVGRVASVFQGGTSTTLYIVTVYLGAVGIRKVRHTVAAGLITDWVSFLVTVAVVAMIFGH